MKEIIDELKTRLQTINGFNEVFLYRDAKPTKYPALICYLDDVDNSFETNQENFVVATFKVAVVINVQGKSAQNVEEVIVPKLYDSLTDYFDENWNFGTTVAGHRIWSRLSMAIPDLTITDKSKVAILDCTLQIKYLKDN